MFNQSDIVRIKLLEVDNAQHLAGDLFERKFNHPIPDFPTHFVLVAYDNQDHILTLGYVHFIQHQNMYLGGGMCVNNRAIRQLTKSMRKRLSQQGGVAFYMLSEAVKKLDDCDAVFGYVGHKGAYKIDLAVGFEQTEHPHLIVYWKADLNEIQKQNTVQTAYEFGPF